MRSEKNIIYVKNINSSKIKYNHIKCKFVISIKYIQLDLDLST